LKTILKHKNDGRLGTLEYSTFGGSVHTYEDNVLCKSLGNRIDAIISEWDIVELPQGYEVGENGGVRERIQ